MLVQGGPVSSATGRKGLPGGSSEVMALRSLRVPTARAAGISGPTCTGVPSHDAAKPFDFRRRRDGWDEVRHQDDGIVGELFDHVLGAVEVGAA